MGVKEFTIFALTLGIIGVSQAQYYGRMRGLNSIHKDFCTCSCEDLSSLIALARSLEEKEAHPPPPPPSSCHSNFEELIMKLVNALVYTTTETTKNTNRCPHYGHGHGYGHGHEHSSDRPHPHSDGGLIDIDVLDPNKKGNVLDVDIANQHLVGVGLGGKGHHGGSNHRSSKHHPTAARNIDDQKPGEKSDNGLVNLNLLDPNNPNNVAELGLGKQKLLGVGLGGGGNPGHNDTHKNQNPNSGEGLVNLDLLNPNKKNNVADVDLGGKNLLGVGLAN